jgi:hypothetical protein
MERLASAGESGTAFLLAGGGRFWLLTDPDQRQLAAAMPPGASARWRALDASAMQELLLAQLWSIKDNERDVLVSHDADEAVQMAAEAGGTAVICNPMPLAAVMDILVWSCAPSNPDLFGVGLLLEVTGGGRGASWRSG